VVSEASKKRRRRPYRLGRRAERQAETHRRIVEAAVELHGSIGPLATTVSAIAERAGVERLTVYRHFPDQRSLFAACTHHYKTVHPPPDPAKWRGLTDPGDRLVAALGAMYRHFSETESVTENILRDSSRSPRVAGGGMEEMGAKMAADLASAWDASGDRARRIRAIIAHALSFYTWRSLVREQNLRGEEAVELMRRFVEAGGR
jgi:AcrR family transcriptional regulator